LKTKSKETDKKNSQKLINKGGETGLLRCLFISTRFAASQQELLSGIGTI